jgi:RimJ/RimL family protein N-acetyltransferase
LPVHAQRVDHRTEINEGVLAAFSQLDGSRGALTELYMITTNAKRTGMAGRDDEALQLRPTYPFRTARLRLRPLIAADVDALLAYRGRPDVFRYVPFEPMTRERVEERVAGVWARTELTDEDQFLILGVELAATGGLIGDVILSFTSREHRNGEIGYVLNPGFAGHGYATEAANSLLRLGFEDLGLHRIVAWIDERNAPSVGVARRLGMRLEARLLESEFFQGKWITKLGFAMLAAEWPYHRELSCR